MNKVNYGIHIKGIDKRFGNNVALDSFSLDIEAGKMHGIIGPEGAGKTTLMRILTGLLKIDSGEIHFKDGSINIDFEKVRDSLAYMPQQQSLYADLSIGEHLDFFSRLYQLSRSEIIEKKEKLLNITRNEIALKKYAIVVPRSHIVIK